MHAVFFKDQKMMLERKNVFTAVEKNQFLLRK